MTGLFVSQKANGVKSDLQQALKKYERPNLLKAIWQLVNTFLPSLLNSMCSDLF